VDDEEEYEDEDEDEPVDVVVSELDGASICCGVV
jgi:hypothetical protein